MGSNMMGRNLVSPYLFVFLFIHAMPYFVLKSCQAKVAKIADVLFKVPMRSELVDWLFFGVVKSILWVV